MVPELLMVEVYCCPTAAKFSIFLLKTFLFLLLLQAKRRADERTRTAYPCSSYECAVNSC